MGMIPRDVEIDSNQGGTGKSLKSQEGRKGVEKAVKNKDNISMALAVTWECPHF